MPASSSILSALERKYCSEMMLRELLQLRNPPGDTRGYLSLDMNDRAVLQEALEQYLKRLGVL